MAQLPPNFQALHLQLCQRSDFDEKLVEVLDEIGVNDYIVEQRRRNEILHETVGTVVAKLKGFYRQEYHFGSRSEGRDGNSYYKSTVMQDFVPGQGERHGPSWAATAQPGYTDQDTVIAFHCKSWPYQARDWSDQSSINGWPSDELKQKCVESGCFVVPTGSNPNKELEWRISTSVAERHLMFNLNITQLRCYIVMKMLIKSFMTGGQKDKISSFMCKSVLLHCIAASPTYKWKEKSLSQYLISCIQRLQVCIQDENCPHFIIPKNNLMANKFSQEVKSKLIEMMQYIIKYNRLVLTKGVKIDNLSLRLCKKLGVPMDIVTDFDPDEMSLCIKALNLIDTALVFRTELNTFLKHMCLNHNSIEAKEQFLKQSIENIEHQTSQGNEYHQEVKSLFAPFISSFLGSIQASSYGIISPDNIKSQEALALLNDGLRSDVSSGRLKLASVLYCSGDMKRTETVLQDTLGKYNLETVESLCRCTHYQLNYGNIHATRSKFQFEENEVVKNIIAFCVIFLPCEKKNVPKELQYEMFRFAGEDTDDKDKEEVSWMDWAVVDSLPYLYFLQYKVNKQQHRLGIQQMALRNMEKAIKTTVNLGHRETAWNLLGQCLEEENRFTDALQCYARSLNVRNRNNAAKVHICKCLANMMKSTSKKQKMKNKYHKKRLGKDTEFQKR